MQTRKRLTGQVILIIKAVKILAIEHKPPFDNIQPLTNLEHVQVIDHAYAKSVPQLKSVLQPTAIECLSSAATATYDLNYDKMVAVLS